MERLRALAASLPDAVNASLDKRIAPFVQAECTKALICDALKKFSALIQDKLDAVQAISADKFKAIEALIESVPAKDDSPLHTRSVTFSCDAACAAGSMNSSTDCDRDAVDHEAVPILADYADSFAMSGLDGLSESSLENSGLRSGDRTMFLPFSSHAECCALSMLSQLCRGHGV